jgi:sugar (pentulose or hexulose) kinase
MNDNCVIAVDTGTTSMRAVLFAGDGNILCKHQVHNPPLYLPGGLVEQDADSWQAALVQVVSMVAAHARSAGLAVAALSLTGFRSAVIPVDADGKPLHRAIMWQDARTQALCDTLAERSAEAYARSGLPITPVCSAVKMRWLLDKLPDLAGRTARMLGVQDYLLYQLTGRFVTDRSLASRTNLYDLDSRDWSPELLALFGVPRSMLCDLIDPGAIAGILSPTMATTLGLDAGIPVVSAGGDQQCAALGMGLLSPAGAVASTGTGAYVITLAARPLHDPGMRVYCNLSAMPDFHVVEAATLAAGVVYRWFADQFYDPLLSSSATGTTMADSPTPGSFDRINADVRAAAPGAGGVLLLPHFTGAGAPRWVPTATGVFHGLGLASTRADLARAVLEGVAAEMAENLALMERFSGPKDRIMASGGLSRFMEFNRILAAMTNRPVVLAHDAEATATGAWISAAVRLGLYADHAAAFGSTSDGGLASTVEPDQYLRGIYADLLSRRSRLFDALQPMRVKCL